MFLRFAAIVLGEAAQESPGLPASEGADALHLVGQQVCDEAHPRDGERRFRANETQHAALGRTHVEIDRDDPARPGESMTDAGQHDGAALASAAARLTRKLSDVK